MLLPTEVEGCMQSWLVRYDNSANTKIFNQALMYFVIWPVFLLCA
jgi:hypothetical protein